MDKTKTLENLLKGKATQEEIELLKQAVASGEISIGGEVNRSVVIIGNGNKVELTAEALSLLKPETKTEEPVKGEPPYMGLRYFDISEADLFYGREVLTRELSARVEKESFLAVVGASGSGKSSVVRAGLIPAWRRKNERGALHIITPTDHPLECLAASLTRDSESVTATSTLMDDMQKDARSLRLYIRKLLSRSEVTNLLLVVDQFEETFTLCKDLIERRAFIENLLLLGGEDTDHVAVRVIITLRADFYHHCFEHEGLRLTLEKHQANIGAMTHDELREAITAPAENNGWDFQPGLVDLILQDVGTEPGALPLLSHALLETWKRRQGRTLTLQGYADAGGVKKAIARTAEGVFDSLPFEEKTIARGIFLRLTELGEGMQDTRRRVKLDELERAEKQEAVTKVLKTLTDARLVTAEQDSAEVAHEALIREWGTLRKWLDEDRESLRLHRHLTDSAQEWERAGRNELYLLHRGGRLDDAMLLRENPSFVFSSIEERYLDACFEFRNKEQLERDRRSRLTVITSVISAVIFLALAAFGLFKSNEAEKQATISLARQLVSEAQFINTTYTSRQLISALLDIQSMKLFPTGESARFLINDNHSAIPIARMSHDGPVSTVAFSPNGKYVVSGSQDGTARVWEAATGREVARMSHAGDVSTVAFSPDGKYVVSGSQDGTARVWEAATGKEVARLSHGDAVFFVAFSPNGRYVMSRDTYHTARIWEAATGNEIARTPDGISTTFSPDGKYAIWRSYEDDTARVWETATGKEVARLSHDGPVSSAAFSPDGKYAVSGSERTIHVWEAATWKEVARMPHDSPVSYVAFSPNGKYVISGSESEDDILHVWVTATGKEVDRITHNSTLTSLNFSLDGRYIVSGSRDGNARIWETATGKEVAHMHHDDDISVIAFSSDGKYVVSGSYDGTARVWEAATGNETARMTHNNTVTSLDFSPDGKYVVSGSYDGTVRVWEATAWKAAIHLTTDGDNLTASNNRTSLYNDGKISNLAFSLDGKYIVSGGNDFTVRIWDMATGNQIARMTHDSYIQSIAFSFDGKYVVSTSLDRTRKACVWEAATGKEVACLTHDKVVTSLAFSPDGKYVVWGNGDHTIHVWEAATGKEVAHMTHDDVVRIATFSPDGKYVVSGSEDRVIHVWEAATGRKVVRMNEEAASINDACLVNSITFSPNGKYVFTAPTVHSCPLSIWDVATGKEVARMSHDDTADPFSFDHVAFSPEGKYVVAGNFHGLAIVWEATTGKEVARINHDKVVTSLAFSPDGKYVISGSYDNTVRIWEAATGKEVARMIHDTGVLSAAFSLDGKYAMSGSEDGIVRRWEWQADDLITHACAVMPRNLNRAEWKEYIGEELPYQAVCPNLPIEEEKNLSSIYIYYSLWVAFIYLTSGWIVWRATFSRFSSYSIPVNLGFRWMSLIAAGAQGGFLMTLILSGVLWGIWMSDGDLSPYTLIPLIPTVLWAGGVYGHLTRFQTGKLSKTKRIFWGSLSGFVGTALFFILLITVASVLDGSISRDLDWKSLSFASLVIGGIGAVGSLFGGLLYIFGLQKLANRRMSREI